ncbi:MAG TPA: hypothetical protein VNX68_07165, partial [Nitrosopumilaceae archaeon]|nr:hypothetical protein [Nitrosopumilaceae archaeon]
MHKISLLLKKAFIPLLFICSFVSAQPFWIEDFGTGCSTMNKANGSAGTMHAGWAVTTTGVNSPQANE